MNNSKPIMEMNNSRIKDLLCFSHLRWDFVYQRPQHLMSKVNKYFRVFFIQEPVFHKGRDCYLLDISEEGVLVVTLKMNDSNTQVSSLMARQKKLISDLIEEKKINHFIAWYYTPMALKISSHLNPDLIIYDCMDELSAFKFAPAELKLMEAELFKKAQLVFTGGYSLYEAKKHLHHNIFPFPSSIDKQHFEIARRKLNQPADQACIKGKKIGFFGVIDERFNIKLLTKVAEKESDWHFILVGPVVKINSNDLPKLNNIHYLGCKSYKELPFYLSGWDIAMIPFEKNESTRFISPTKTPEYLAGGKPVISTSITDVVIPYGNNGLVNIADTPDEFIAAANRELQKSKHELSRWLKQADEFLKNNSWDSCVHNMMEYINPLLHDLKVPTNANTKLKSVA